MLVIKILPDAVSVGVGYLMCVVAKVGIQRIVCVVAGGIWFIRGWTFVGLEQLGYLAGK